LIFKNHLFLIINGLSATAIRVKKIGMIVAIVEKHGKATPITTNTKTENVRSDCETLTVFFASFSSVCQGFEGCEGGQGCFFLSAYSGLTVLTFSHTIGLSRRGQAKG